MVNARTLYRHELSNAITTLSILIMDCGLSPVEKRRMERSVRKASLMIAYEPLFLGKGIDFPREEVELGEMVGLLCSVYHAEARWELGFFEGVRVPANRNALFDALELLVAEAEGDTSKLVFEWKPCDRTLRISRGPGGVDAMRPWPDEAKGEGAILGPAWAIQLAYGLFRECKVGVRVSSGGIDLDFGL
jgi:hypothetical protein